MRKNGTKGGSRNYSKYCFKFEDQKVEIVKAYNYLGIDFSNSGIYEKLTKSMVNKARIAAGTILSLINRNRIDFWRVAEKLFLALVV